MVRRVAARRRCFSTPISERSVTVMTCRWRRLSAGRDDERKTFSVGIDLGIDLWSAVETPSRTLLTHTERPGRPPVGSLPISFSWNIFGGE